jgi:hypothetical protein
MIEEEPYFEPEQPDDGMLYDFAKFTTTLAFIVLGGILSLTQLTPGHVPAKEIVTIVVVMIGFACLLAIVAAATLARLYSPKWSLGLTPKAMLNLALFLISVGAGVFLAMWQKFL